MRGFFMWKIFKLKTKLQYEVDEYIVWKASKSVFTSQQHEEILKSFIKPLKYISIAEICLEDISNFHKSFLSTPYGRIKAMQAVRGFMAYFYMKKQHNINPKQITDIGIKIFLPSVHKNVILEPMIKPKVGRPPNIAFIKEIKHLVDKGGLGIREIARAKKRTPSNIHRAYHYNLSEKA